MEKTFEDDEIEIDLLELLGEFRRRIWMIFSEIFLEICFRMEEKRTEAVSEEMDFGRNARIEEEVT